jgi:molybdate/tungstate transport system permease protein
MRAAVPGVFSGSLRNASSVASILGAAVVWLALLGPFAALVAHISPSAIRSSLSEPQALQPLETSLVASAATLGVLVAAGTPLAWMLARDRLPFPRIWETGVLLLLLMPPLVLGLLLVYMAGPLTPVGHALSTVHLTASNTFFALVLAEVYESAPYFVLGAQAAFASVDRRHEEQAALLGDRPFRSFRRVTLPLAAPGLANALAVAWARAMGAFGAVIVIAYHPYGLPLQVWTSLEERGPVEALPFALLLLVVSLPLPVVAYLWSARSARFRSQG